MPWQDILLFIVVVPAIWLSASVLSSMLGGWRELASRYAAPKAGEATFVFASISLHAGLLPTRYANCVTVRLSAEGFGLAIPFLFMHPPVLIPWSAVRECREGGFVWRYVEVALSRPDTRIRMYGRAGAAVHQQWLSARSAPAALTSRRSPVL
jgi:hypothetical protein